MLTQIDAAGRNYPALFLALDDVLEAVEDGRPDELALQRSFGDSADAYGATGNVLAVLYLQNQRAFGELDRAWIEVYARALGRVLAHPR